MQMFISILYHIFVLVLVLGFTSNNEYEYDDEDDTEECELVMYSSLCPTRYCIKQRLWVRRRQQF